ncbi:hypothetical protein [Salinigranum halophilum]|uniref:hypothetical protein n=1 Tax=Salinigranum halophilum TaxID=2565931 RepID=UPI0013763B8B|nr:hypothetical protein [Salinigranum halophilum]
MPEPGDIVVDSEDGDPDTAVVVAVPGTCAETEAYDGMTVHEATGCDPDERAVEVVFVNMAEDAGWEWRTRYHTEAPPCATYAFPEGRLEVVGEDCGFCGRRVPRLYAHLAVDHTGQSFHQLPDDGVCPVCNGEYAGRRGMIQHARKAHEPEAGRL